MDMVFRGSTGLHYAPQRPCYNKEKMIENKFIIFCPDHFNPLGVIRSLGEVGIRPFVILYGHPSILVKYSKYIEEMHWSATIADGYRYLQDRFGNETKKPFLLATSDDVASYLDLHFNELCDKFYFFNAGAQGRLFGTGNRRSSPW